MATRYLSVITFIAVALGALLGMAVLSTPSKEAAHTIASAITAMPQEAYVQKTQENPQDTHSYIEVTTSCGPYWQGECLNARTGPGIEYPSVLQLRTGVVLAVSSTTVTGSDGRQWYQVVFNEWLRYPNRTPSTLFVNSAFVEPFTNGGSETLPDGEVASTTKRIIIDRSDQKLYAYDGDTLFMETAVSTGLDLTPTPRGTFTVYYKSPSRYMQGPLPGISDQYYDLPGVPFNIYFTREGGAIHGAYWHDSFGQTWSHGCVNLPLDTARKLYDWTPLGTPVYVHD